jgi:hypothetical protein
MWIDNVKVVAICFLACHELSDIQGEYSLNSPKVVYHLQQMNFDVSALDDSQCIKCFGQVLNQWVHIRYILKLIVLGLISLSQCLILFSCHFSCYCWVGRLN